MAYSNDFGSTMLGENVVSAAGANALLSAATTVLIGADDLRALLPADQVVQRPDSALAQPVNALVPAHLDVSAADAARQELWVRIALGSLFGLAVAILLTGLSFRSPAAYMSETAAAPDARDSRDSRQASGHPSAHSSRSQ